MFEGFPHSSHPTGWFQFAWSAEISPGEVRPLRYFDRELVAYRGESGELHVLDAHCLHMGAHLGYGGSVERDCIRCPFHGWLWDGSGQNAEIPYGVRPNFINLRTAAYPVEEIDGLALMWFSPSGAEPTWKPPSVLAPYLPSDFYDLFPHCTRQDQLRMVPQLIAENTIDFAHLKWVHRWEAGEPEILDFRADGPRFTATMRGVLETPRGTAELRTTMNNWGVGLSTGHNIGLRPFVQVISAIPVDSDTCDVRLSTFVTLPEGEAVDPSVPDKMANSIVRAQAREVLDEGATGDRNIWGHMRYVPRPPLVAEEMDATKALRRWAGQFYEEPPTGKHV